MDHLPKPIDGKRPEIPFEAEARIYRPPDFIALPKKYGYDDLDQLIEHGLHKDMDPKLANAFLQEWLWFALLSRVLDKDVDSRDFLNHHIRTLHTADKILEKKIMAWKAGSRHHDSNGEHPCVHAPGRYIQASHALAVARRFVSKHLSYAPQDDDDGRPGPTRREDDGASDKTNEAHEAVDNRISLSIAILGEILQRERPPPPSGAPLPDREEFWQDPSLESKRWGYSKYCREQLQANKWCMGEIRRIESTMYGVCEVYYSSSMKPPRGFDHSSCDMDHCNAPLSPTLGHVEGYCAGNCGPALGFDDNDIAQVLRDNKTPLVTFDSARGRLVLHEFDLKSNPPKSFGALSHAWDDVILGIGSDARGGNDRRLLQCRAKKMQNDFNKLINKDGSTSRDENVPFYVDVLCYPRQVGAQPIALNQMRQVYSKASEVLVWDRELLRSQKLSDAKMIEMNVKIRLGNWTKSLWTLFEAVLAKRINVALSDGILTFEELRKARHDAKSDLFHDYHHVYRAGHPLSEPVYHLRKLDQADDPKYRAQRVWEAVQFQKIDRVENEAPILAALMKLDINGLDTGDPRVPNGDRSRQEYCNDLASRRMVKLLELMNQTEEIGIPSGLIFMPSERLRSKAVPQTKHFGWAARTWLTRQAHPRSLIQPMRATAITHTNGLLVKFPGIILHCPESPLQHGRFWVPVTHTMQKWFKVTAYPEVEDIASWWQRTSGRCDLMIVLSEAETSDQGAIGLLVKGKGTLSNGQIRWVDVLCRVWIRLETDREFIRLLSNSFREFPDRAMFGTKLADQDWCVDGLAP
ncbi:putative Heterokaryon incompatibility domain-containing protein [Seiridium cardinale]|uniref:Heterokaryon incompatibility domain-containing protein n=1 Tax=Seiridium cardinale TaxID=138064 RepID=A0ABR2XK98_9PEZI